MDSSLPPGRSSRPRFSCSDAELRSERDLEGEPFTERRADGSGPRCWTDIERARRDGECDERRQQARHAQRRGRDACRSEREAEDRDLLTLLDDLDDPAGRSTQTADALDDDDPRAPTSTEETTELDHDRGVHDDHRRRRPTTTRGGAEEPRGAAGAADARRRPRPPRRRTAGQRRARRPSGGISPERQPRRKSTKPMSTNTIADRYALGDRLGSGGMSTVYQATDQVLERTVAVKVLAEHLSDDEKFVARFRREALAVAKLVHPNIVQVYDTGVDAGPPLHRHGVRRGQVGRAAAPARRRDAARHGRRDRRPVVRRARLRPPPGDHPPRRQARQPDGHRRPRRRPARR